MKGVLQSLLGGIYDSLPGQIRNKEEGVNGKRLVWGWQGSRGLLRICSLNNHMWVGMLFHNPHSIQLVSSCF